MGGNMYMYARLMCWCHIKVGLRLEMVWIGGYGNRSRRKGQKWHNIPITFIYVNSLPLYQHRQAKYPVAKLHTNVDINAFSIYAPATL
jgi:hypothetical protein